MDSQDAVVPQTLSESGGLSILGIISTAIGLLIILCCVGFFVAFMISVPSLSGATYDPVDPLGTAPSGLLTMSIVLVLCVFGSPLVSLVGLGLGIGGLFEKQKTASRVFPIIGIALNAVLLLTFCGMYALGFVYALGSG